MQPRTTTRSFLPGVGVGRSCGACAARPLKPRAIATVIESPVAFMSRLSTNRWHPDHNSVPGAASAELRRSDTTERTRPPDARVSTARRPRAVWTKVPGTHLYFLSLERTDTCDARGATIAPIGGVMNRWWLVCLALATGCGGGASSTPTAPAVPLVTRITISGSDLLLVGSSETFAAAIESGNVTVPRWSSDAPTVATVDLSGHVTAVGTGTATISADANGVRGTKLIRTLPNFAGSWRGGYQETACDADGEFVHPCDSYWDLASGTTRMTLTQDGATVSGSFDIGP